MRWERHWLEAYGAVVAATPQKSALRAWPERACRWAAGKRQLIEGVIWQLKDQFSSERYRAKTLGGLLARLAATVTAYTRAQVLNARLGRPLRHLASLLIRAIAQQTSQAFPRTDSLMSTPATDDPQAMCCGLLSRTDSVVSTKPPSKASSGLASSNQLCGAAWPQRVWRRRSFRSQRMGSRSRSTVR